MTPLVSVIIPTYNSARTIQNCLISIQNQTYKNIEIIVVDNFSTDGTREIAKKFTGNVLEIGPERTAQKNHGIKTAKGDYLLIIDGDMTIDEGLIEECIKLIGTDAKNAGVCIPVVDTGKSFWTRVIAFERSFYKGTSMEAARFLRADSVTKVGGYKDIIFYEEFIVPQEIELLGYSVRIHSKNKIYHDYDDFSFIGNLKKKFYYGKTLQKYREHIRKVGVKSHTSNQTDVIHRYLVFLKNLRFYKSPHLAILVIVLKTFEFISGGLGFVYSKIIKNV